MKIYKLTDIISHPYTHFIILNYQVNYLKCVPYLMRNSCHKRFTSASFLHSLLLSNLPRSSVKSDLCQISAHFYSKHHCQNGYDRQHLNTQWLYRLHEALTKCGRLFTEIRLVKVRHNTKQACLQGGLWNQYTDPIEDENLVKFMYEIYTQYKNSKLNMDKIPGQKSFKNDTKCIITHIVGPIGPYEACNPCT